MRRQAWEGSISYGEVRILVTGSRVWADVPSVNQAFDELEIEDGAVVTVVHGSAQGLDSIADEQARLRGWYAEAWLPNWNQYGKLAGPVRNQGMVDSDPLVCLGFPLVVHSWSGTMDCMCRAYVAKIPVFCRGSRWEPEAWMLDRMVKL